MNNIKINFDVLDKGKAIRFKTDGTVEYLSPAVSKLFRLNELQDAVGGYVETCPQSLFSDAFLFVDEDGLLKNREYNKLCSEIFGIYIVGDALLVSKTMVY